MSRTYEEFLPPPVRTRVHVEDVEWLLDVDTRATVEHIAWRLHVTTGAVYRSLTRAGRTDLRDRLARNSRDFA